jgi:hypothetical protein
MPQLLQEVNHFDKIHIVNLFMNQSIRKFQSLVRRFVRALKLQSAESVGFALLLVDTAIL